MNFGKAIVSARKKAGLSQVDLAKKLDVATGTVAGWELGPGKENGHGFPLHRLDDIANALGLSVDALIKAAKVP